MTEEAPARSWRRWLPFARITFLVAAFGFGWLWLRDDWDDVVTAMGEVGLVTLLLSLVLVLCGLVLTGLVWMLCVRRFGHDVALRPGLSVFFVGQLGKYIPGSVWSLGAQAQMATRYGVPGRTTVAAGLVFLGWNVVTAVALAAGGALLGAIDTAVPAWVAVLALVVSVVGMLPPVVNRSGSWAAGTGARLALTWADCGAVVALLLVTWFAYGRALFAVSVPEADSASTWLVGAAVSAFAAAYAVGVVVILAPAGLGAREAVLTLLLTPYLGVAGAVAAALLTRVVHTVADFGIAGVAWLAGRASRQPLA